MTEYLALIGYPTNGNEAFGAVVPEISGCFSAGDTYEETLDNVKEALEMQLEFYFERDGKFPERKLLKDFEDDMKDYPSPEWQQVTVSVDTVAIEKDLTRENDVNFGAKKIFPRFKKIFKQFGNATHTQKWRLPSKGNQREASDNRMLAFGH